MFRTVTLLQHEWPLRSGGGGGGGGGVDNSSEIITQQFCACWGMDEGGKCFLGSSGDGPVRSIGIRSKWIRLAC